MNQSIQKCTNSQHHCLCLKFNPHTSNNTCHCAIFKSQPRNSVLPHIQVGRIFYNISPFPDKLHTIVLSTRAPHCRTFRTIEHPELDSSFVAHYSHLSTQRINLTNNLPLCNSAHGRVATHLRNIVHIHCYEQCL